jgi:beta-lactamase regulating signal transducer with metallopeptidase domain
MMPDPCLLVLPNESLEWLQLLLDVALKGVVILLAAGALVVICRRASAAARHLLWSVAVACLLLLPIFELGLPNWRLPVFPALLQSSSGDTTAPAAIEAQAPESQVAGVADLSSSPADFPGAWPAPASRKPALQKMLDEMPPRPPSQRPLSAAGQQGKRFAEESPIAGLNWAMMIFMVWSAGFLAVLARLAAGTFKVWLIARRAEPLNDSYWTGLRRQLAAELGLGLEIGLLKSSRVAVPMTWGVLRPVVLLPVDADDWSEECCRIVLLHELAHIKRRDCLTQMLAQLACALHWFNPLVWSAASRLRVERELACDDQVLEVGTRASDYASHLVALAGSFEPGLFAPSSTVGMACSQLESRVVSILNPDIRRRSLNRSRITLAAVLAVLFVVPLSVVQPWVGAAGFSGEAALIQEAAPLPVEPATSEDLSDERLSEDAVSDKALALAIARQDEAIHAAEKKLAREEAQELESPPDPEAEVSEQERAAPKSESEGHPAAPGNEENYRFRLHNITPEFIEAARRLGFENLSANQLIQMRVHQIDENFVNQVRGWGYANASLNQMIQLRISGVNGEYIEALKRAGFDKLTLNRLANLKLHNVTPEYIDEMRRLGFNPLSVDQLLSLKVHRINEAFVREAQNWGFGKLSLSELLQIRVHNLTPNFAQEMKALGFDNLSLQKLLQLRVHNVSAEYLQEMRGLGFDNLTAEQAVQMRIHGITADYVKRLRAAGFNNISVTQLLDMKRHGIDDILLKNRR